MGMQDKIILSRQGVPKMMVTTGKEGWHMAALYSLHCLSIAVQCPLSMGIGSIQSENYCPKNTLPAQHETIHRVSIVPPWGPCALS